MTEKGLQIVTETPMFVGETVALEFQLVDRALVHCALLITHVQNLHVGGRIIQICTEHQEALTRFLGQMVTANLVGMGSEPE